MQMQKTWQARAISGEHVLPLENERCWCRQTSENSKFQDVLRFETQEHLRHLCWCRETSGSYWNSKRFWYLGSYWYYLILLEITDITRQGPRFSIRMVIGIFCSDTVFVQLNQFSQILSRQCCLTEPGLPNQNYWSKQSTPGSVVPLAMFWTISVTGARAVFAILSPPL